MGRRGTFQTPRGDACAKAWPRWPRAAAAKRGMVEHLFPPGVVASGYHGRLELAPACSLPGGASVRACSDQEPGDPRAVGCAALGVLLIYRRAVKEPPEQACTPLHFSPAACVAVDT
eukprot:4972605-Pyramimonas_sp.AAC.1